MRQSLIDKTLTTIGMIATIVLGVVVAVLLTIIVVALEGLR